MTLYAIAFLTAIYILLEAIDDVDRYSGFDRACLVARDVLTGVAGIALLWYTLHGQIDWLHVGLAVPLALYIWPKMVHRALRWRQGRSFWGPQ